MFHDVTKPAVDGECEKCDTPVFKRREDDNEISVRTRLMNYYRDTSPLIGYYHAHKKLVSIDGMGGIEDVAASVRSALA